MFDVLSRITELREQRGWSTYRLSQESSIPQSTIATWYSKNFCPPVDKIERICDAMNITLSDFFEIEKRVTLTTERKEIIKKWDRLSTEQMKCVIDFINNLIESKH